MTTIELNDAARRLLDDVNLAVLATLNPDGSPQTSVVWVALDGDDLLISSAAGRRKVTNVERDARVSLTVYDRTDPLRYLEVRGTATVTEDLGRKVAVALAQKYAGPDAGEEYLALPPEVVRVAVRITPQRLAGNLAR
ncbi:PPOX class F420-dependent oxidoreductase [Kitasatospora sp. NPDC101801]|uniref:PPOX class F420-dependent oxidoreductase n=1 Tax=Kitasatospora sp. NPDC101801 TaxID=3364103 RepID=UPI003829700C